MLVVVVDMTEVFTVPCEEARSNSTTPNTEHICTRTCSVEKSRLFQLSGHNQVPLHHNCLPIPVQRESTAEPLGRIWADGAERGGVS